MAVAIVRETKSIRELVKEEAERAFAEGFSKAQYSTPGQPTRQSYGSLMTERTRGQLSAGLSQTDPDDMRGIGLARFAKLMAQYKGDGQRAGHEAKTMYPDDPRLSKALNSLSPSAGGFLVPVEYVSEIIPLLRDKAVTRMAGTLIMPMNNGTLEIPKLSGAASATYGGENAIIVASQESFGNLAMTAKKLSAMIPVSNDLLRFASMSVDKLIRDDIVLSMALKQDLQFIRGDGTLSSPLGIRFTPGVQINSLGTNGAQPDQDTPSRIIELAQEAHAMFIKPAWLMNSRTWRSFYTMKTTTGAYIFRDEMRGGTLEGYPFYVTNQIPNTLTQGNSSVATELYFGDFNEAVIAEADTLEVDASNTAAYVDSFGNTQAAYARDQTVIRAITRHDFGLRQPTVFVVTTGVLAT